MAIKKGDFIEVEYTGRLKEEGIIFDTTDEKTAKSEGLFRQNTMYGPVMVCVGERQLLKGIDEDVVGKNLGKYTIEVTAEDGFGKKNAKFIHLIPTSKFKKQGINPVIGLQVEIDGAVGTIKTVTGGRCMVDFNHPLSGKDLVYDYKILSVIEDDVKKVEGYIKLTFGLKDIKVEKKENKIEITTKTLMPKDLQVEVIKKLKQLVSESLDYAFLGEKKEEKKENN